MEERNVKKLEEMNLLDDFLFGSVVTYPEIGERFVKILLRTIFGREFKHLSVTAQKVFYGADTDKHGARLDLYLEAEIGEAFGGNAVVYDIEPDKRDCWSDRKMLPRRTRFYHGKIAARSLDSGTDYDTLKNVVVIMILPFDPFGLKRMVYTSKIASKARIVSLALPNSRIGAWKNRRWSMRMGRARCSCIRRGRWGSPMRK